MKNQIEFSFRGDRKVCSRARHSRRAEWARMWFRRMHQVVEEAEDQIPLDELEQHHQPASSWQKTN